ncbi:MAG: hypothetical protein QNK31_08485 [Porticoccus sp.]|nr:hypothetical protein [Porticoccus sp.]
MQKDMGDRATTVLLIDDDPSIVEAITMILESTGVRVHGAAITRSPTLP